MPRKTAYVILVTAAVGAYVVAAFAGLWIAPQTLRASTPDAYAQFGGGSVSGIVMYAVIWTLWSVGSLVVFLIRVKRSDAWTRVGRHRYVSIAGSVLMVAGLVASGSWTLWMEVDLAAEHVTMYRDRAPFAPIATVWAAGLCAITAALLLGALGGTTDRIFGKAPHIKA